MHVRTTKGTKPTEDSLEYDNSKKLTGNTRPQWQKILDLKKQLFLEAKHKKIVVEKKTQPPEQHCDHISTANISTQRRSAERPKSTARSRTNGPA